MKKKRKEKIKKKYVVQYSLILENTNEKDEFKEPCLIILDDPISSFDMENKVGLYTFFRMMFDKIIRNNNESKIINFTHSQKPC